MNHCYVLVPSTSPEGGFIKFLFYNPDIKGFIWNEFKICRNITYFFEKNGEQNSLFNYSNIYLLKNDEKVGPVNLECSYSIDRMLDFEVELVQSNGACGVFDSVISELEKIMNIKLSKENDIIKGSGYFYAGNAKIPETLRSRDYPAEYFLLQDKVLSVWVTARMNLKEAVDELKLADNI